MKLNFHPKVIKIAGIAVGLVLSMFLLVLTFNFISGTFTRAANQTPQDVVINNVTQNAATVKWTTQNPSQGVIEYGTSQTALNFFAPETSQTPNHSVDLTLLAAQTTYYFQIRIGDQKYDNGGVPWTFATKGPNATNPLPTSILPTKASSSGLISPTPVSSVVIPPVAKSPSPAACTPTDCIGICKQLGKGCTTQDLVKANCVGKVNMKTCQ